MNTSRRRRMLLCMAACTTLVLAACGDDDDDAAADTEAPAETTAAETTAAETTAADVTAGGATGGDACTPYVEVSLAFNGEPDSATLTPMLDALDAAAPAEIADELATMTSAAREVVASGGQDFSAFETPEFTEAQATVDPWMFDNCEFDEKVETTAVDYAYDGMPSELTAGRVAVLMTNEGTQAHELRAMRKADGVTQSWDEILALPEEEAGALVEQIGGAFAPTPGSQGLMIADLAPGDYLAVCFIPVGTSVSETGEFTEGTGPPHFTQGMRHEFTVS